MWGGRITSQQQKSPGDEAAPPRADGLVAPEIAALGVGLARDFARFAGRSGLAALGWVGLGALTEGVGLLLLIPILALATRSYGHKPGAWRVVQGAVEALGVDSPFARLSVLLAGFAALMILRALAARQRDLDLASLKLRFVTDRRVRLTRRLADARWDVAARLRHARVTHVLSHEVPQLGGAVNVLMQGGVSVVMLLGLSGLAFVLSPWLALTAVAMVALGGLTLAPMLRKTFAMGGYASEANLHLTHSAGQFLSGLKLAVSQDLQDGFVAEIEETAERLGARRLEMTRRMTARSLLVSSVGAVGGAAVVLVGYGVMKAEPAVLMTTLLVMVRISGPALRLQQGLQQFALCLPAYAGVKALEADLDANAESKEAGKESAGAPAEVLLDAPPDGRIEFRNVSYDHHGHMGNGRAATLHNLDLTIEPGSVVGIAGVSGVGKTTFADLLAGLYPPQEGDILIGGVPLEAATVRSWRRRISYVAQDPFLFHDTIRKNLTWGLAGSAAVDAEPPLWAALRLAGAESLVRGMALGLDTVVGERGALVSGGERQRLAMARAVLRRPRLYILDEATSAMDVAGERALFKGLRALAPTPTVVVIAHRTETLDLCDRVLTLEKGRFRSNFSLRSVSGGISA